MLPPTQPPRPPANAASTTVVLSPTSSVADDDDFGAAWDDDAAEEQQSLQAALSEASESLRSVALPLAFLHILRLATDCTASPLTSPIYYLFDLDAQSSTRRCALPSKTSTARSSSRWWRWMSSFGRRRVRRMLCRCFIEWILIDFLLHLSHL
jgi:hypothetical protein